jgi:hypothetical protein
LFPGSASELTPDQHSLAWWSSYYDSIYQMLPEDQPEDDVVDDDEALDKYMSELHKERSKERYARKADKKFGSSSAMKMKEVLVMRSNPDYLSMDYDEVKGAAEGKVGSSLQDEMAGTINNKTKNIKHSKRFVPNKGK